eukprot:SAG31_NODE_565_length_14056_cov_22.573189_3_plen_156_part_00
MASRTKFGICVPCGLQPAARKMDVYTSLALVVHGASPPPRNLPSVNVACRPRRARKAGVWRHMATGYYYNPTIGYDFDPITERAQKCDRITRHWQMQMHANGHTTWFESDLTRIEQAVLEGARDAWWQRQRVPRATLMPAGGCAMFARRSESNTT